MKMFKVLSEEMVDVAFEGVDTKAKKIVYDIKGISSALIGMNGAKNLIVYYVAAPVRGNYIACIMSRWNNNPTLPSGLSPLMSEVMILR